MASYTSKNTSGNITSSFQMDLVFEFEKNFDQDYYTKWMSENWFQSVWYSAAYVLLIFGGRHCMQKRPAYELRPLLAAWNVVLAGFSIFATVRVIPETVYVLREYGWVYSICNPSHMYGPTRIWSFLFTASKLYELGDTAFIVLRKQPLIFLHWYHHVLTMIYVWYSYPLYFAPGRWFGVMNFVVHSFMYTYYAFRALRFRIPRVVMVTITVMQISQMFAGLGVILKAYQVKLRGDFCHGSINLLTTGLIMYCSYLMLFLVFFYRAYIIKRKPKGATASEIKPKHE